MSGIESALRERNIYGLASLALIEIFQRTNGINKNTLEKKVFSEVQRLRVHAGYGNETDKEILSIGAARLIKALIYNKMIGSRGYEDEEVFGARAYERWNYELVDLSRQAYDDRLVRCFGNPGNASVFMHSSSEGRIPDVSINSNVLLEEVTNIPFSQENREKIIYANSDNQKMLLPAIISY